MSHCVSFDGWCHYGLRQFKRAIAFYSEALSLDGNLLSSRFDLALILTESKRFSLASREYQQALDLAAPIGPLSRRGFLHVALIDLQHATKASPALAAETAVQRIVESLQAGLEKARAEGAGAAA